MFTELKSLLAKRSLTITVASLTGDQIRVNVVPHSLAEDKKTNEQIKYSHKDEIVPIPDAAVKALTTPLSLTGTAEEIDAKLSSILVEFAESHKQLQASFDRATMEISDAVKAIDERNKSKAKSKQATSSKKDEKEDSKTNADDKSKKDDTLPLWWTTASAAPPGTPAPQQAVQQADAASISTAVQLEIPAAQP
jgi:PRTRC genetic system protein E